MQTHLWSQSISVKSSRGHQALLLLAALLLPSLILFSCGGGGGGGGGDKTPAADPLPDNIYLWTTSGTHMGNLGGIEGANNVCEGDTDKTDTLPAILPADEDEFTYKHQAVLAVADPAFHPDSIIPNADTREVQRPDGTKIADNYQAFAGSTNAVAAGVTPPPPATTQEYWTGLTATGNDFIIGNHCDNWRDGTNGQISSVGLSQKLDDLRLARGVVSCDVPLHLLCVSHLVTK